MEAGLKRSVVSVIAAVAFVAAVHGDAFAQAPPASSTDDLTDVPPPRHNGARAPLAIIGGVTAGLGAVTLFAAGITWMVAWGDSRTLSSDCPNGYCVEGTPGGDAYVTARDAGRGANVLVGIGLPVLTTGVVLLFLSSAMGGHRSAVVQARSGTSGRPLSLSPRSVTVRF